MATEPTIVYIILHVHANEQILSFWISLYKIIICHGLMELLYMYALCSVIPQQLVIIIILLLHSLALTLFKRIHKPRAMVHYL